MEQPLIVRHQHPPAWMGRNVRNVGQDDDIYDVCSEGEELWGAAENGNLLSVRRSVDMGMHPDSKDVCGSTALHCACRWGHETIVKYLVRDAGADVRAVVDQTGDTPLHEACCSGSLRIVKFLLEKGGADLEARSYNGKTPLHSACSSGHLDIIQYLVQQRKANVAARRYDGETPLHTACRNMTLDVIQFLVTNSPVDADAFKLVWRKKLPLGIRLLLVDQYAKRMLGLSDTYFEKYPLHTFLQCPLPSTDAIVECIEKFPTSVLSTYDDVGRIPLHIAISSRLSPSVVKILEPCPNNALLMRDPTTGFYPFEAAAVRHAGEATNKTASELDLVYWLLRCHDPAVLWRSRRVSSEPLQRHDEE
mmetsp:Transcript_30190/g.44613  ORF Transcript_30190/g.44613 Transcript_30190/m.44613 type:complete len:363 (-) Transcript_30190:146-1234(-)